MNSTTVWHSLRWVMNLVCVMWCVGLHHFGTGQEQVPINENEVGARSETNSDTLVLQQCILENNTLVQVSLTTTES